MIRPASRRARPAPPPAPGRTRPRRRSARLRRSSGTSASWSSSSWLFRVVRLRRARPARREHARHPVERVDAEAGVVGDRRQSGDLEPGPRLEQRVALERRLVLDRLVVRRHVVEPDHLDAGEVLGEDPLHLGELLGVAGGQEDPRHEESASCCSRVRSAQPFSPSASSASSSARENAAPSAVPCTSTNEPGAGHHDVHVRLGAHVLLVGQVEPRDAVDDPDRDGGHRAR